MGGARKAVVSVTRSVVSSLVSRDGLAVVLVEPSQLAVGFPPGTLVARSSAQARSASSLWWLARRSAESVPASTASRTAQPGSVSCWQSLKRHARAMASDLVEGGLHRVGLAQHADGAQARRVDEQPAPG